MPGRERTTPHGRLIQAGQRRATHLGREGAAVVEVGHGGGFGAHGGVLVLRGRGSEGEARGRGSEGEARGRGSEGEAKGRGSEGEAKGRGSEREAKESDRLPEGVPLEWAGEGDWEWDWERRRPKATAEGLPGGSRGGGAPPTAEAGRERG